MCAAEWRAGSETQEGRSFCVFCSGLVFFPFKLLPSIHNCGSSFYDCRLTPSCPNSCFWTASSRCSSWWSFCLSVNWCLLFFFQDANLSIHTDNPDFTPCFQNTILAWIPSIYLWTALPFYLLYLKRSKRGYIVLSMLSRFKTVRSLQCSTSDGQVWVCEFTLSSVLKQVLKVGLKQNSFWFMGRLKNAFRGNSSVGPNLRGGIAKDSSPGRKSHKHTFLGRMKTLLFCRREFISTVGRHCDASPLKAAKQRPEGSCSENFISLWKSAQGGVFSSHYTHFIAVCFHQYLVPKRWLMSAVPLV